ncbi:hypothetical protein ZWY2020_047579 [Hordeum vulgare]|nr:hypothetical protein ZWY2020_047579 [Hordeum vulgare]
MVRASVMPVSGGLQVVQPAVARGKGAAAAFGSGAGGGGAEAFSCVDGEKEKATKALAKSAREILPDVKHTLRYKALMQCRLLNDKGGNMTRNSSCHTNLEKEEYLSAIPFVFPTQHLPAAGLPRRPRCLQPRPRPVPDPPRQHLPARLARPVLAPPSQPSRHTSPLLPLRRRRARFAINVPEVACDNAGVELVVADAAGVPLAAVDFARVDHSLGKIQIPFDPAFALLLQVVRFACGGVALKVATNHLLADGRTFVLLLNCLAEMVRAGGLSMPAARPVVPARPAVSACRRMEFEISSHYS